MEKIDKTKLIKLDKSVKTLPDGMGFIRNTKTGEKFLSVESFNSGETNEHLLIEDEKSGVKIILESNQENISDLIKMARGIRKSFFNNKSLIPKYIQ